MNAEKKLLVIDDEPAIREGVRRILESDSFQVETFASGYAALERIKQQTFDLVITDLKMPGISGMEVMEAIKEIQPDLPVIFITGYSSVDSAVEVMKLGAVDYIAKPFTTEGILNTVKCALEQRVGVLDNLCLRKELGKDITGVTAGAMQLLQSYSFPGNVRELENIVERAVVLAEDNLFIHNDLELGDTSTEIYADLHSRRNRRADDFILSRLRDYASMPLNVEDLNEIKLHLLKHAAENVEKGVVISALQRHAGNVTRASEETGMLRPNFQEMMKKIGITAREYADS